jgi:two-component system, HptB-dependent secretion and biofilm response regulator
VIVDASNTADIARVLTRSDQHVSFAITLMEHLVVPTFVLDGDRRVLIWNRACERLTNIPASEIVGTRDHWRAFYKEPRPCLADLVVTASYEEIANLYSVFENSQEPTVGVHAENWCWMPHRGQRLYLAVDAGPVYNEHGQLIAVVETLRDITEKHLAQTKVLEQANQLKAHFEEHQREAELARRILEHQIRADQMREAGVNYVVMPAANFSGDLVLAARSPSGRRYALLGDATGHGLSAAVSVLPIVQEFYRLVELNTPLPNMIESINFLLANSLPMGRFVAAAFVMVNEAVREGEIWVGGVPDVLLFDDQGHLRRRFTSNNLPLGISRSANPLQGIERFIWEAPCQLLVISDGVLEASDSAEQQFGNDGLLKTLKRLAPGANPISLLKNELESHLNGEPAHDDVSMLVIPCP